MSSSDDSSQPEGAVQARFAVLFQSFIQSPHTRASPEAVGFLLGRLQPRCGARLICCDRSTMAYGWGLTAQGCAISVSASAGDEPFDGAVWSLDEVGNPPDAGLMARLGERILPGGRLVIDAGHERLINGWGHFPVIATLTPLGVARAPDSRRLYVWLRED